MSRIAFVIGVNRPKALAPLQGAVNDALAFAAWIAGEGYEVKTFTDDHGPVFFAAIFDAVDQAVSKGTATQIVIYFAGHGFQNGGSEIWLLSGAPDNPGEAISVEASVMAARESGLKSVVLISDACRSIPSGLQSNRVDGLSIFPNRPLNRTTRPEIDRLFATLPSLVAVEAARAGEDARRGGVFTRELMRGYRDTPPTFIDKIFENGEVIEVVTNRKMKKLVRELVEDAAFEAMPQAAQLPEFILESVDAYVARVTRADKPVAGIGRTLESMIPGLPGLSDKLGSVLGSIKSLGGGKESMPARTATRPRPAPAPSATRLAREAIQTAVEGRSPHVATTSEQGASIARAIDRFSTQAPVDHFETRTGFFITGADVVRADAPGFVADVLAAGVVRLQPEQDAPSASVLIEFATGTGTVLPGLRGYIGHVFVDQGGVTNVNYVPSTNDRRWPDYQAVRGQLETLRATVAAAAGLGVFRVDARQAQSFAQQLRQMKLFDPTLGLYAAYGYASAGLTEDVAFVHQRMRSELDAELFDVAILARRGVHPRESFATPPGDLPILPFCPMLRQGWSLLAVQEATLPDAARQARDWLLPSLWTSFASDGVKILRNAIERGDFQ